MSITHQELKAYAGVILSMLIIGLSFIFMKIALRAASPVDVLAHRFTAATVGMMVVYASGKVKLPEFNLKKMLPLLLLSLFYPLLAFAFQAEGLKSTTASEAGIVSALMPVITVIMAALFLKEKSTPGQVASVAVSFAGIFYILYRNGFDMQAGSLKGNLLILLSVLSVVVYYLLARKINHRYNALDITFFMTIAACVGFNASAVFSHAQSGTLPLYFEPLKNTGFLWSVIYLGVLSSFFTSLFTNYALSIIPAPQVAIFTNLTPIITILSGVALLRETLYDYHIVGSLLVMAGVIGTMVFHKKKAKITE